MTRDKSRNNQNDRDLSIVLYLDSYPRFLWSLWHSVQGYQDNSHAARPGRCEAFLWSMIMGGSDLTLSRWSGTISSPVSCLSAVWASFGCRWGIGAVLLGGWHCHSLGGVFLETVGVTAMIWEFLLYKYKFLKCHIQQKCIKDSPDYQYLIIFNSL